MHVDVVLSHAVINDEYEPRGDGEENILEFLKEEGRSRPSHMYDELDLSSGAAQHYLERLLAAGWINRPYEGTYEFVADPRGMSDAELADLYIERVQELDETVVSYRRD